jgi:hypothetical protein
MMFLLSFWLIPFWREGTSLTVTGWKGTFLLFSVMYIRFQVTAPYRHLWYYNNSNGQFLES